MLITEKEYKEMIKEFGGFTFTPITNVVEEEIEVDGKKSKVFKYEVLKTADEVYQEWLNNKSNPLAPQPSKEELLTKEVANIKIDNMKKDVIITNALQTIASLKVEIMNMKGGNV